MIPLTMFAAFVIASPSPKEMRETLRNQTSAAQACHDSARNPALPLRLVIELLINKDGTVKSAYEKTDPPFPDDNVIECVLGVVERLEFGRIGKPALLRYPFLLVPPK